MRVPPSGAAIGVGAVAVVGLGTTGALIVFGASATAGAAMILIALGIALAFVLWHVRGTRYLAKAAKTTPASSTPAERSAPSGPTGPIGIDIVGSKRILIEGNEFGPGLSRNIRATDSEDLTVKDNIYHGNAPGRTFVQVTPAHLAGLYKAHTSVEADHLMTDLIGKWITVKGPIEDVLGRDYGRYVQIRSESSPTAPLGVLVGLVFRGAAADSVVGINRESEITAVGQIRDADTSVVHLDNCELVSARRRPEITE